MVEIESMPCRQSNLSIDIVDDNITVFHPDTKKSYIIGEAEYNVLIHLDGVNSYETLAAYSGKYSVEQVKALLIQFEKMGFISGKKASENIEKGLFKRRKLGIIDGNKFIKTNSWFTRISYFVLVYLSIPLFIVGGLVYYRGTNGFRSIQFQEVLSMTPLLHIVSFIIIATLHELSHAVIARKNNIPVPEIGIMLYICMPYVYTNMSYIRLLRSRWKRILCLIGGILLNILLAGIFFFIAGIIPIENKLILEEIAYMNLILVISNLMIFFKLDGYFILQEIIGETYLREKSIEKVKIVISEVMQMTARKERSKVKYERTRKDRNMFYVVFGMLAIGYIPVMLISFAMNLLGYFF